MRKIDWMIVMGIFLLAACGGNGSSTVADDATLAPVPEEYAGLTNPLGA